MSSLRLGGMILCQGLHDCTSAAIGQVREVGDHLKRGIGTKVYIKGIKDHSVIPWRQSSNPKLLVWLRSWRDYVVSSHICVLFKVLQNTTNILQVSHTNT